MHIFRGVSAFTGKQTAEKFYDIWGDRAGMLLPSSFFHNQTGDIGITVIDHHHNHHTVVLLKEVL